MRKWEDMSGPERVFLLLLITMVVAGILTWVDA